MDRKAILRALATSGGLSRERQLLVRAGAPAMVLRSLLEWGIPAAIGAAELPSLGGNPVSDDAVVSAVALHLAALGLPPAPLKFVAVLDADGTPIDTRWGPRTIAAADPAVARVLVGAGLPGWTAYIVSSRDSRWEVLRPLAQGGVFPVGLDKYGRFVLARA